MKGERGALLNYEIAIYRTLTIDRRRISPVFLKGGCALSSFQIADLSLYFAGHALVVTEGKRFVSSEILIFTAIRKPRGSKKVASIIKRLVSIFGTMKLREITVAHLTSYRKTRLTTLTSKGTYTDVATVNRELSTMRAMLNDAITNDWLVRSPFTKAKKGELIPVAHETKRDRVLSPEEEEKLLAQCETEKRRHLKALIIAGIDSGCRQGELLGLKWSDVDFQANSFTVRSYKGRTVKTRPVPITRRLREALLDLRAKPSPSTFRRLKNGELPDQTLVFGIVSNIKRSFDGARVEAGLPDLHFHDTRHCAGTALSTGGMSLALVGEILGHSDPRTTYRYINRTSDTVSDAAKILNKRKPVKIADRKRLRGK